MPTPSASVEAAIAALPHRPLHPGQPFQDAFLACGVSTLADACRWTHALPYGCTADVHDVSNLFVDRRGNCHIKHGAVARLAEELDFPLCKQLGFYRLTDDFVTGVGALLEPHGLSFVPYMHCFLEWDGRRIDLTEGNDTGKNRPIEHYDVVVPVAAAASTEDLRRIYREQLPLFVAAEPALGRIPPDTLMAVLKDVSQLTRRCAPQR